MKIRMACEWKNFGRFAIDHFVIDNGLGEDENKKLVKPVHRHYLTCYFKASTYSEEFTDLGFHSNLNLSGQVLPFSEISEVMKAALTHWNEKLIYPYSERLQWKQQDGVSKMTWNGASSDDSAQRVFKREWDKEQTADGTVCSYNLNEARRLYDPKVGVPEWDKRPFESYEMRKQLSIASKCGTTEEIARELMIDFLREFIVRRDDDELNREYKMTFRLNEETGKESDYGVEATVKGRVTEVVDAWENRLVLMYAAKIGWGRALELLRQDKKRYGESGDALLPAAIDMFGDFVRETFRDKMHKTLFLMKFRQDISAIDLVTPKKSCLENVEKTNASEDESKEEFMELWNLLLDCYSAKEGSDVPVN